MSDIFKMGTLSLHKWTVLKTELQAFYHCTTSPAQILLDPCLLFWLSTEIGSVYTQSSPHIHTAGTSTYILQGKDIFVKT